ncbi:MAG: phosphoribosylformylglycinamidine synthase subunit PurQ [Planctomycetia bacterium]|nr:phosphoribosylformylglycinamidine synthase subunit PurQ [Planctomycetia bacterium]
MAQPRVLVLRAPGTNCDLETAYAFERAGAVAERLHINRLRETPAALDDFQILCLPGGFSYGDDVSAGRILGNQIRVRLGDQFRRFRDAGKLILGICNGFQILLKSGILLEDNHAATTGTAVAALPMAQATLALNESGRYEDRWVRLRVAGEKCVFLKGIDSMYLPVAHAEGKFVTRDAAVLKSLEAGGQAVLKYRQLKDAAVVSASSSSVSSATHSVPYPDNPNGATNDIAGICDATGRVCGLMPHPERHLDPLQHPRWTRLKELPKEGDGFAVFKNAVGFFK